MTDYFDFRRPAFREPPKIASAPAPSRPAWSCVAHAGLNPPLPGNPNGNASLSAAQSALRARAKAAGLHV